MPSHRLTQPPAIKKSRDNIAAIVAAFAGMFLVLGAFAFFTIDNPFVALTLFAVSAIAAFAGVLRVRGERSHIIDDDIAGIDNGSHDEDFVPRHARKADKVPPFDNSASGVVPAALFLKNDDSDGRSSGSDYSDTN